MVVSDVCGRSGSVGGSLPLSCRWAAPGLALLCSDAGH